MRMRQQKCSLLPNGPGREVLATAASFFYHSVRDIRQFLWNIPSCKKAVLSCGPCQYLLHISCQRFFSHNRQQRNTYSWALFFPTFPTNGGRKQVLGRYRQFGRAVEVTVHGDGEELVESHDVRTGPEFAYNRRARTKMFFRTTG
jgi:hypothetical protein